MALLDPRAWLAFLLAVIVSLGAGGVAGYRYEKQAIENTILKTTVTDSEVARNKEHVATESMGSIGTNLLNDLTTAKAKSDNELAVLKAKLAASPTCPVSGAVVGMLYPATNSHVSPNAATGFGIGSASTYADSSCSEQLELAARNYREVCEPNAEQLKAVQDAYNTVREQLNDKTDK